MKKKGIGLATLITAVAASMNGVADVGVGLYGGTTGAGIGITYGLTDSLNLRGTYNAYSADYDEDIDDFAYDLDLDLQSIDLLLDWHVFSGLRLSVGVVNNANELSGTAKPRFSGSVEYGDEVFDADDIGSVNASVEFDDFAPYLGIGFGNAVGSGHWALSLDLGVIFQGSPNVRVAALAADGVDSSIQAALDEATAAEIADVEDEVDDFEYYPVLRLGIAYKF